MSEEHASGFRFYSFGIVVETKPEGTDYILASPVEELYLQESGIIREKTKDFKGKKKSVSSVNFQTEHESKNFIRAKWVDISGGNRVTPPDVVVNETVLLMKYGNVDEYFWCTFGREPELRRLEDVLYSFSNLPSGIKAYDKNTSYWVHVSTKHKFVHIHTSMNDGEHTIYDVKIDTKAGKVLVKDGVGDSIEIDSPAGKITIIARSEIIRNAPKIIDNSDIHIINTTNYTNNAKNIITNAKTITNNSNSVTNNSNTITNKADSVTTNANTDTTNANTITNNADSDTTNAKTITNKADSIINKADSVTTNAKTITNKADSTTNNANTITNNAPSVTTNAESVTTISNSVTTNANSITNNANTITNNASSVINTGDVITSGSDTANFNLNAKCICPNCRG